MIYLESKDHNYINVGTIMKIREFNLSAKCLGIKRMIQLLIKLELTYCIPGWHKVREPTNRVHR